MTFTALDAASLLDTCSAGIVLFGVLVAGTTSLGRAIWLVAAQAVLLAVAVAGVGIATNDTHLVFGALLTLVSRGIVVPLILARILRASPVRSERDPYIGPRLSLIVAIVIVFAAAYAVDGYALSDPGASTLSAPRALPASVAVVLTGLMIAMTRRKGLSIVLGLLIFENGLALTAFSLTYGMPFVVELGATFDLLMVVVAVAVYARRMLTVFGTLSTDQLRNLRG